MGLLSGVFEKDDQPQPFASLLVELSWDKRQGNPRYVDEDSFVTEVVSSRTGPDGSWAVGLAPNPDITPESVYRLTFRMRPGGVTGERIYVRIPSQGDFNVDDVKVPKPPWEQR